MLSSTLEPNVSKAKQSELSVEHRGQLLFHVNSQSKEEEFYVVDLSLHGGKGECTCKDWATRCQPRIKGGYAPNDYPHAERINCKHVHACLVWLGHEVVRRTLGQ